MRLWQNTQTTSASFWLKNPGKNQIKFPTADKWLQSFRTLKIRLEMSSSGPLSSLRLQISENSSRSSGLANIIFYADALSATVTKEKPQKCTLSYSKLPLFRKGPVPEFSHHRKSNRSSSRLEKRGGGRSTSLLDWSKSITEEYDWSTTTKVFSFKLTPWPVPNQDLSRTKPGLRKV